MIPRYSRVEMARIWAPETRFRIWFEIEAHACDALARLGTIPEAVARAIWAKGDRPYTAERIARIEEIERVTRHDTAAFVAELAETIGAEGRFVHLGLTSSDVIDTALAVQLARAADLLLADIDSVLAALERRAFETKELVAIGRSHGIHAEPVTMGLKFAGFFAEFQRDRERLVAARREIATCTISGAMGTYAEIDPAVEAHVAAKLGLVPEPHATQVIPRDRHAAFFAALGVVAGSVERVAIEVRNLQRTEVGEAEEYFSSGQKGSSSMPHKRNPVLAENLTGLARLVRAYVTPALEDVALWHERDISHSSVERVIAPDATLALDFALARLADLVARLVIYPESVARNLARQSGLVYSQSAMLALTLAGMGRDEAYALVQRHAMAAWEKGDGSFRARLSADPEVAKRIPAAQLESLFDPRQHTKHVDTIFRRVFGHA